MAIAPKVKSHQPIPIAMLTSYPIKLIILEKTITPLTPYDSTFLLQPQNHSQGFRDRSIEFFIFQVLLWPLKSSR